MTTPTRTPGTATDDEHYPVGDPVSMTQVIGQPYETTVRDPRTGEEITVGIAEHIVAVTGVVDEVGDVFVPGGFTQAMKRVKAKGVSGHDWGVKVSKALEREEWMPGDPRIVERIIPALPEGKSWPREAGAVYVKAQYNLNTPEGKRAYENAKFFGADECYSVGYKVRPGGARKRGGKRYLSDFDWYEWSDVLHGANSLAFGLSVKSLLDSELEYSGGRLVQDAEVKAAQRYVRDSQFWGLPLGTPIRTGMKPRGPKARKQRLAGETPDPDAGTTTKKPSGSERPGAGKPADEQDTGKDGGKRAEGVDDEPAEVDEGPAKPAAEDGKAPPPRGEAGDTDDTEVTHESDAATQRPDGVAQRVSSAVTSLADGDGEFVRLADVREALDDVPADELDAELKRMSKAGEIHLAPDSNPKARTDADNAAAITIGGEPNHLIALRASTSDGDQEGDRAPDAGAVQTPSTTSTDRVAAMGKREASAAAAEMDDTELADHDEVLTSRAAQLGKPGQRSPAHQAIADERAKRGKTVNEQAEDEKHQRAVDNAPEPVDQDAARARAEANRAAVRGGARRRPEPPADPEKPAGDGVPADVQARMDAAKREGRDNEAAKIYAEHLRNRRAGSTRGGAGEDDAGPDAGSMQDPSSVEDDDEATEPVDDSVADDEIISADDLADGAVASADAHGLIEADDGELEVTPEVAERQDRVEALLEGGEDSVKGLDDTQLDGARRDVAAELDLQEEIARRDRQSRRPAPTAEPAEDTAPEGGGAAAEAADTAPADDVEGDGSPAAEAAPEKPKTRAGLAGAAEDYADALEADDEAAATAARTRLEASLRRSRSESENAQALRDLLAGDDAPDPARLRELATAMRDEAREHHNAQARSRRLAKRLERERLRSLLGQIDAEMRTRGLPTDRGDGPPNAAAIEDDGPPGQDDGVLSAEDLAAARAATDELPPVDELPVVAAGEVEPDITPVIPAVADVTGLRYGEWTGMDRLPVRVAGAHYEASIEADTAHPGKFEYSFRVLGPDGDIAGIGSGKADTLDDARRYVVQDLAETYNGVSYRGLPPEETLPDAPPEPTAAERAETVHRDAAVKRQTRDNINPITGQTDFTVAPQLADQPAGVPPFNDVAEVREHLAATGAPGFGTGSNVQWDTALLSPGGGLMIYRTTRNGDWTIVHTSSGYSISRTSGLGRKDARDLMGVLDRITGPKGQQIDWTQDAEPLRDQLVNAGLGVDVWPAAMAAVVAKRVDAGDYTSKLVLDARRSAALEYRMGSTFPNWKTTFQHMLRTNGALSDLLNNGRARTHGEDRSTDEINDDRATLKAGKGAINLMDLGAPDKAAAALERRADELEAKYGRGSGPYDVTSGGASSRGSVMLRRMADDVRTMVNTEPQGVEALGLAKPGDRFLVLDNSPKPGNPQVDPKKSYRTFTVLGRVPRERQSQYDNDVLLEVREDNAPPGPRDTMTVRVMEGRGLQEPSVVVPQWVNQGSGQRQQLGEAGERWVPMAPDSHSAMARNANTRLITRLAPGEEPPTTFRDAQDRVKLTTRDPNIEQAIAAARARIDDQAGDINVTEAPKQRASRTRSTARAGGRAAQPNAVDSGERENSPVSQAVLDTQVANQIAIVGGPIEVTDTAPNQGYDDIAAVRQAWVKGATRDGAPMPGDGAFARDKASDDRYWNGVKLSPAGHFLVMSNGDVTHADTGALVTSGAGPLPTQAAALRYADMLERAMLPSGDGREALDWTGADPDAMRVIRAANQRAKDAGDRGHTSRIRARAILDEGVNPGAVKAVLNAVPGWDEARKSQDARALFLDVTPWGEAFQARSTTQDYTGSGFRNYWLGGKLTSLNFPSRAEEKKSDELRKLLLWGQSMSTAAPYTVADELCRYQREHDGDVITYTTQELVPGSSYDRVSVKHEANLGEIVGKIADKLEHDADPTRWSEEEKLVSAGEGKIKLDSLRVNATIDRLASDNDNQYIEREAHLHTIVADIGAGGIQMRYDQGTRQWVAVLPRHDNARAGMGDSGPLEIRKPGTFRAAPRGHESDEVLITPDGGLRLQFRVQGNEPDIYSPSIARLSIPPGAWSLDDGSKPGEAPNLRPSDIDRANPVGA